MSAKFRPAAASPSLIPPAATGEANTASSEPFHRRHPKIANAVFAAVCVYVAMICLLALDQVFHWGIFGPKIPLGP